MYFAPKYKLEKEKATKRFELQQFMASMRRHNERRLIKVVISKSLVEALSTDQIDDREIPATLILRFQALAYLMSHPTSSVRLMSEAAFMKLARSRHVPREFSVRAEVAETLLKRIGRRVENDRNLNVRYLVLLQLRSLKQKELVKLSTEAYLDLAKGNKFSFAVDEYSSRDIRNLADLCEYSDFSEDQRNKMLNTILFLLTVQQANPELTQGLANLLKGGANFSFRQNEYFEEAFAEYFGKTNRSWMDVRKARVLTLMLPMDDSLMAYLDHYRDEELSEPLVHYVEKQIQETVPCEERYQLVLLNVASSYSFKSRGRLALNKNLSWRVFGKFLDIGLPLYATKAIRGVDVELYEKYTSASEVEANRKILERYAKHWPELGREMEERGLL